MTRFPASPLYDSSSRTRSMATVLSEYFRRTYKTRCQLSCKAFNSLRYLQQRIHIQPFCLIRVKVLVLRPCIPVAREHVILVTDIRVAAPHHLALPNMSQTLGRGPWTLPTVAESSRVGIMIRNGCLRWPLKKACNHLVYTSCRLWLVLRCMSRVNGTHLYMFSLSSYPVWMGPVLGRLCTISTARSNCASMSWRESMSILHECASSENYSPGVAASDDEMVTESEVR